jgi:hypothetical protein
MNAQNKSVEPRSKIIPVNEWVMDEVAIAIKMGTHWTDKLPKSEQTIVRNKFNYKGLKFINDMGEPCEYRIIENELEVGIAKYHRGRLLVSSCRKEAFYEFTN